MAYILLDRCKLRHNYNFLNQLFDRWQIHWSVVSKLLCGNELFIRELDYLGVRSLCDARVSNLKAIKKIAPHIETIYIKPPPHRSASSIVRYADISFNTEYRTLEKLSAEAVRQGRLHRVVLMVELGERREGILPTAIGPIYEQTRQLPGIKIIGLGTNFTCLLGVLPDNEKLAKLVEVRDSLAREWGDRLPWVSGGSSVAIPLLQSGDVPIEMNHFRVGETLFFGTDVYNDGLLRGMFGDVITVHAEIIELIHKPWVPDGALGSNLEGNMLQFDAADAGKITCRAIVDIGLLDVESSRLKAADPAIACVGASSDMLIIDLGRNPQGYKTGDHIEFRTDYMGVLRLMNSRYITKKVQIDASEISDLPV